MASLKSYFTRSNKKTFKPKRKFLLFSSIDVNRSAYNHWLECNERNFDVVLYVYKGELNDKRVDYSAEKEGFKFQNFYNFANEFDVFHYDAVWVVDDDIEITTKEINELFNVFKKYNLWIGQPSYDLQTAFSWYISVHDAEYLLRYTNFVENGVVMMSNQALKVCLPTFKDIESGWGSDFIWPKILGFPEDKIAIIDKIQCHHPSIDSSLNNNIARELHHNQGYELMKKYHAHYFTPRVLSGIYI